MAVTLGYEVWAELLEGASLDSRGKNVVATCPFCGRAAKFGVSIKKEGNPWQCLHARCGERGRAYKLLGFLGRLDLLGEPTVDRARPLESIARRGGGYQELDLELEEVALPEGFRRVASHPYLEGRGFVDEDFFAFEVGTATDFRFRDYVIFPVRDQGRVVGYVSRHVWEKGRIDRHNARVAAYNRQLREGEKKRYKLLRYRNSTDNETGRMLYNYDSIAQGRTHTVIVVEGIFDVINITRQLDLYEDSGIVVVACFGSKLSREQAYKLQLKGVRNLILFFDADAIDKVKESALELQKYFDVLVAYNRESDRDAGDLSRGEILDILDGAEHPYAFRRNVIGALV